MAGGKRIARIQNERYPETPIEALFSRHGDKAELREVIDGMAVAVATEVNILDPDQVLLGGGVLGKFIAWHNTGVLAYSVWFYFADIAMVTIEIILYFRNTRLDRKAEGAAG